MTKIINFLDVVLEDFKVLLVLIQLCLVCLILGGNIALANTTLYYITTSVLVVITALDILFFIISVLSIFVNPDEGPGFLDILLNLVPIIVSILLSISLYEKIMALNISNLFLNTSILIYSSLTILIAIPFSFLAPSDEDDEDEDEIVSILLRFLEKIKVLAFIFVIFVFFNNQFNFFPSLRLSYTIPTIVAGIVTLINIVIAIVDFIAGDNEFGDYFVLVLNIIVNVVLVLSALCANVINEFLVNCGISLEIVFAGFCECFIFGFIAASLIEIVISIPINLVSNIADFLAE